MVAGVYVPYFFIQSYALDLFIDESMTFNVVAIMNAATFFGRFPYNYLADMYAQISHRTKLTLIHYKVTAVSQSLCPAVSRHPSYSSSGASSMSLVVSSLSALPSVSSLVD
jgi:hypothetical protein